MAPPLERRSTYLSGWAEARKVNTDHVWEDVTGSNEFNNAIGVGYCLLSRSIVSYINFDLTVESTMFLHHLSNFLPGYMMSHHNAEVQLKQKVA